jgi:hypothetical protein
MGVLTRFVMPLEDGGRGRPEGGGRIELRDSLGSVLLSADVGPSQNYLFGQMAAWGDLLALVDPSGDLLGVTVLRFRRVTSAKAAGLQISPELDDRATGNPE